MNENWISFQHNTQYLSTMNWTYIGLLQTLPSSICVRFTDFSLNSVTFHIGFYDVPKTQNLQHQKYQPFK